MLLFENFSIVRELLFWKTLKKKSEFSKVRWLEDRSIFFRNSPRFDCIRSHKATRFSLLISNPAIPRYLIPVWNPCFSRVNSFVMFSCDILQKDMFSSSKQLTFNFVVKNDLWNCCIKCDYSVLPCRFKNFTRLS